MKQAIKILIINSRKDQLSQTAALLSLQGYEVLISDSQLLGYQIAKEKKPNLVLQFIHDARELPSEQNISEVNAFQGRLLLMDSQALLPADSSSNPRYILHQAATLAENLPELVADMLEYSAPFVPEQLKRSQVLVVDDELMNRTYYEELILSMGFYCDACSDLSAANAFLKQRDYDLVVSDVMLGDTIGLVLINVIAELKRKSLFMVVTGLTEFEFKEQFGEFTYAALLHKPVSPAHFRNTVLQVLLKRSVSAPSAAEGKSHYNPERVYRLLKNNKASIDEVMQNFALYLSEALRVIAEVKERSHLNLLRKSFHDLGNLCYYFGAEVLFEMIGRYSGTHNEDQKLKQILDIAQELSAVAVLHEEGMREFTSSGST